MRLLAEMRVGDRLEAAVQRAVRLGIYYQMRSPPLPWVHTGAWSGLPKIGPCPAHFPAQALTSRRRAHHDLRQPGTPGAVVSFKPRYGNYIGGEFVPPVKGEYFVNTSPVNGEVIAEFPRSGAEDIERALDAAHAAADAWGRTSVQDRANILLKIADRIEANLEKLAVAGNLGQRQGRS